MRSFRYAVGCLVAILGFAPCGRADVKLHGLFTDGMVLQQGMNVAIWGAADEGETVKVKFLNQEVSTTAKGGKWRVALESLKAGGPHILKVTGKNVLELKDVYVGEVWVCSGQSNMAMSVSRCLNAAQEIARSKNPLIRLYTVPRQIADEPQEDVKGKWMECGPETVAGFSAVGYFFGRELQKALGVPIGLINASVGGTPAEAWTSKAALESKPELRDILTDYAKALEVLPEATKKYEEDLAKHKQAVAAAIREGKMPPPAPRPPMGPQNPRRPFGLFNGMIAPLVHFGIAGVIWYQGEGNATRASQYRVLFPTMIQDWRRAWGQGDFPFLFVQLAAYRKISPEPQVRSAWAELREAQLATLSVPKTAMAVTIDVGDQNDIHPKRKQEVGARLALAALAVAYGRNIEYSGPLFHKMTLAGDKAIISFTHVGSGLEVKGPELKGFAVAGADRKFVWAKAQISGNQVVVWSPVVKSPLYVRYGWADYPECNLYNKEGLPASPFRTDALSAEEVKPEAHPQ